MNILLGLGTAALGGLALCREWGASLGLLKTLLSVSFICGGLIAVSAGIASFRK